MRRTKRATNAGNGQAASEGATPGQALVAPAAPHESTTLQRARAAAAAFVTGSASSQATRQQYAHEQRAYLAFCQAEAVKPLDHDNAVAYLAHLAGRLKVASVRVARAALVAYFKAESGPDLGSSPAVKALIKGITIAHAYARPPVQARPIEPLQLQSMVQTLPGAYTVFGALAPLIERFDGLGDDPAAYTAFYDECRAHGVEWSTLSAERLRFMRDRAILLVSWGIAARRSEIMGPRGLRAEDVVFTTNGATIRLRQSKTDQRGRGTTKALFAASDPVVCPVRALRAWLDAGAIERGPAFPGIVFHETRAAFRYRAGAEKLVCMTARHQTTLIKDAWQRATGEDPALISGHSMRRGAATAVARATGDVLAVQRVTGHASVAMAAHYVDRASLATKNPFEAS